MQRCCRSTLAETDLWAGIAVASTGVGGESAEREVQDLAPVTEPIFRCLLAGHLLAMPCFGWVLWNTDLQLSGYVSERAVPIAVWVA